MPIPLLMFRVVVEFRVLNTLGPNLLEEGTRDSLQLVVGQESGYVDSMRLHCGYSNSLSVAL